MCTAGDIDRNAVNRLMKIVEKSNAYIVISSSWRIVRTFPEIQDILATHGVPRERIIGMTPRFQGLSRGDEIAFHAKTFTMIHDQLESFVILDDSDDMNDLIHRLVKTSWETGLIDEHIPLALNQLNDPWEPYMETGCLKLPKL